LFSDREGSVPAAAELVRAALERARIDVEVEGHMVELVAYRDADDE